MLFGNTLTRQDPLVEMIQRPHSINRHDAGGCGAGGDCVRGEVVGQLLAPVSSAGVFYFAELATQI